MTPKRIQLRRTKGWRKPEGAVVVDRRTRWGNPYRIGDTNPATLDEYDAGDVVKLFRRSADWYWGEDWRRHVREELGGRDLACWCALDEPCHADVLLELANP